MKPTAKRTKRGVVVLVQNISFELTNDDARALGDRLSLLAGAASAETQETDTQEEAALPVAALPEVV